MPYKNHADKLRNARARYARHPEKKLKKTRAYAQAHPEKARQRRQRWRAKNHDRDLANKRQYQAANAEKLLDQGRAWRAGHREQTQQAVRKWAEAHRDKASQSSQRWAKAHPHMIAHYSQCRRAREKNAPVNDLTHAQWIEIQAAQAYQCYYCGKRYKGKLTQDHITPLSGGGSHTLHNVIGACRNCNSQKRTKKPPVPVQPLLLTVASARKKRAS